MRVTNLARAGFLLSVLTCIGFAAGQQSVQAAGLTKSWTVENAYADGHNKYSAGHSFWLPHLNAGGFVFNESGLLEEFDDGTARLTGTVVSSQDANKFWDVDVWFDAAGEKVRAKNELKDSAFETGKVNLLDWRYYGIDENRSRLTGGGYYEDIVLQIADGRGYGMGAETQIGYGASGKNIDMGMASWISYNVIEDNNAEVNIANSMKADINVDLMFVTSAESNIQDVPEPMTLAGLGLVGLGLCSRRKSCNETTNS